MMLVYNEVVVFHTILSLVNMKHDVGI